MPHFAIICSCLTNSLRAASREYQTGANTRRLTMRVQRVWIEVVAIVEIFAMRLRSLCVHR
jgi:hypothetical protein